MTREYIDELKQIVEDGDEKRAIEVLKGLHAADIAEIYDDLNIEEAKFLYLLLDGDRAANVLAELEENDRENFLAALPSDVIAKQFIDFMDSDDAADVIADLPDDRREEVLAQLVDMGQAGDIVDLLNYHEDTAGGLMAKEMITVNEKWNVETCIKEIRKLAGEIDDVYVVYVIDDDRVLKGILSLKKLIISSNEMLVSDICNTNIISVKADAPAEEVAIISRKYDMVTLPVVDRIGRLIGRITIDDIVDVMQEEAERDYQLASGLVEDVEPSDTIWVLTRARLPWLIIGLAGGILGARVIRIFESDMTINTAIAFFLPLIAAMGGNVGVQSSSIVVQAIASQSVGLDSVFKRLVKEFSVAMLNGILCASILLIVNLLLLDSLALTFSVSIALFIVIVFASISGTFIPLTLHRLKIDPALATGPFITTINDITGMLIYLSIARYAFLNF
ncbi:MAG: magnesium transporter [Bacteroidales bacterium]|nr:magnesium transporter [Bacteroidales bacterium]